MGGRCSLACTNCTTPIGADAIAVDAAVPTPKLARSLTRTPRVTRSVTTYQATRSYEEVSPYTTIRYPLAPAGFSYLHPFPPPAESWNGFPFYRRNVGKRVLVSQLSLSICKRCVIIKRGRVKRN